MTGCIVQEDEVVLCARSRRLSVRGGARTTEPEIVRIAVGGQLLGNFARLKVAKAAG